MTEAPEPPHPPLVLDRYTIQVEVNGELLEMVDAPDLPTRPQATRVHHAFERRAIDTFYSSSFVLTALSAANFQHSLGIGTRPTHGVASTHMASLSITYVDDPPVTFPGRSHRFLSFIDEQTCVTFGGVTVLRATQSVPVSTVGGRPIKSVSLHLEAASIQLHEPSPTEIGGEPFIRFPGGQRLHVLSWSLDSRSTTERNIEWLPAESVFTYDWFYDVAPAPDVLSSWNPVSVAQIAGQHTGDAITRAFAVQSADVGFVVYAILGGAVFRVEEFDFTPPEPWARAMLGEYAVAAVCFGTVKDGICHSVLPLEELDESDLFPGADGIRFIGRTITLWHNHAAIVSGVLAGRLPYYPINATLE